MKNRRMLGWALAGVFAFSLLLCGLAVRELADPSRCSTGEFDTVRVERLAREWVPPRVLCRVTLRDGSSHDATVHYWPAFALAGASGLGLLVLAVRTRRESRHEHQQEEVAA